jgi:hypothetical protein
VTTVAGLLRVWPAYKRLTELSFPRRFPIAQFPNLPLIVAILDGEVGKFLDGSAHSYAESVSYLTARTDDLRITRGLLPGSHGMTCTDGTANGSDDPDCTGIPWPPVPRPVPRICLAPGRTEAAEGGARSAPARLFGRTDLDLA